MMTAVTEHMCRNLAATAAFRRNLRGNSAESLLADCKGTGSGWKRKCGECSGRNALGTVYAEKISHPGRQYFCRSKA